MLEKESINLLKEALEKLESGFSLPQTDAEYDLQRMSSVLQNVAERMCDNFPYFHPLYVGQMLKPPHPIARTAYQLAMWINPNNHALDGGRASSAMEKEVVADLANMFGFKEHLGHLTSGGTVANMEALWVAREEHPRKMVVASDQAHYTHSRISSVLQIPFQAIKSDRSGRIDLADLERKLKEGNVGTVVVTMGTTGLGKVDSLKEILELKEAYDFRIHADSAYGGYFRLAENLEEKTKENYSLLREVDSIVIDPHKHGLQPYGCGCILFRDTEMAKHYLHDSPYTYFTSDELHLGEISLECSRAGATAVGLWATHQLLPPHEGGTFAEDLEKCREAALKLCELIRKDERFGLVGEPELDIVVWVVKGDTVSEMSRMANELFSSAAKNDVYLSKLKLSVDKLDLEGVVQDEEVVTCLRCCLMKPEHVDWIDRIWEGLQ